MWRLRLGHLGRLAALGAGTGAPERGRTLVLDENGNGTLDHGEVSTTTDARGRYGFTGLVAAQEGTSYTVALVFPLLFTATPNPRSATLSAGLTAATVDFTVDGPAIEISVKPRKQTLAVGGKVGFRVTSRTRARGPRPASRSAGKPPAGCSRNRANARRSAGSRPAASGNRRSG
jgi:hypothetical protein